MVLRMATCHAPIWACCTYHSLLTLLNNEVGATRGNVNAASGCLARGEAYRVCWEVWFVYLVVVSFSSSSFVIQCLLRRLSSRPRLRFLFRIKSSSSIASSSRRSLVGTPSRCQRRWPETQLVGTAGSRSGTWRTTYRSRQLRDPALLVVATAPRNCHQLTPAMGAASTELQASM